MKLVASYTPIFIEVNGIIHPCISIYLTQSIYNILFLNYQKHPSRVGENITEHNICKTSHSLVFKGHSIKVTSKLEVVRIYLDIPIIFTC